MAKREPHNRDVVQPPLPSQQRDWGDWGLGETGLLRVPTRLGNREQRWLVCCLALAIFVPPAARTEDGPSKLESVVTRARGHCGWRTG